jgi:predicted negative regulator of RcsB-dependent stress response
MSEMRTEEEQIEAIKNWWKENGKQTVVALAVVATGWFGFQGYQGQKQATGEAASAIYQEILSINDSTEEADKGRRSMLLDQLKSDYKDTVYASFASLFNAKDAVDADDLAVAETELRDVVNNSGDEALTQLATVRLARVLLAMDKKDEALALVVAGKEGAFEAEYEETKGDILFAQGNQDAARDAYSKAVVAAQRIGANNPMLQMKLDDLAVNN